MDDSLGVMSNRVSNESIANSDEYEFVNEKSTATKQTILDLPMLNIANNGNLEDLQNNLHEVLAEDLKMEGDALSNSIVSNTQRRQKLSQSKFYDVSSDAAKLEKELETKPPDSCEEGVGVFSTQDNQESCTVFNGVSYLGAAKMNAPKSEAEIQRNMKILNSESADQDEIKISISIPNCSQGSVILKDSATQQVISQYEVQRILFYARGECGSSCAACFAFTWSHGDTLESAIFQCHVFRCDITEAVRHVSNCFSKAFQRFPRSMTNSLTGSDFNNGFNPSVDKLNSKIFIFEVALEIKEDDGKGAFGTVPKDRNCFKLRSNVPKLVCMTIHQVKEEGITLVIDRGFGVLISSGRNVKHSDMRLLEMYPTTVAPVEKNSYSLCGRWDVMDPALEALNTETSKEGKVHMTVAVDLVIRGIREPVRFVIETSARIFPQNERFYSYFNKRTLIQQFFLHSKEIVSNEGNEFLFEVQNIETSGEIDRNRLNLALNLAGFPSFRSPSLTSIDTLTPKEDFDSDGDEPMLSGTGEVSKDCSADELQSWAEVLDSWQVNEQRPKLLPKLVKQGIPEALRGEVWQRLSNCDVSQEMMDKYRLYITKESGCEGVIKRDINRTFPAHDYFKESGGLGQDSLYRISKAYAVYDEEVGYCQGLSFLVASLLLHMPEEQAFCVLVRLMYDYGLRDLYKDRFDNLHMRFYQLNRLLEDQLPDLYKHFCDRGIETHMFAAQWFLTLFTARFPLYLVFHILDVFLLQGLETLFQVAIALLTLCKKDLLQMDFESNLKYFRVHLPKRCRNEEVSRHVMKIACSVPIKKLKKYEAEFATLKEAQENVDEYGNEVQQLKDTVTRCEEEKQRLEIELYQIKEMLQREVSRADQESRRNTDIISEYKQICQRLEDDFNTAQTSLSDLCEKISKCEKCSLFVADKGAINSSKQSTTDSSVDPMLSRALEKVRELELELAQTKLAQVEAECRNQALKHKLNATKAELNSVHSNNWLSKTFSSIKEATNKKDMNVVGMLRRESAPVTDIRNVGLNSQHRGSIKESL